MIQIIEINSILSRGFVLLFFIFSHYQLNSSYSTFSFPSTLYLNEISSLFQNHSIIDHQIIINNNNSNNNGSIRTNSVSISKDVNDCGVVSVEREPTLERHRLLTISNTTWYMFNMTDLKLLRNDRIIQNFINESFQRFDAFYDEILEVMTVILEIGFIDTKYNLFFVPNLTTWTSERLPTLLKYLEDYNQYHLYSSRHFSCYYTLYDGWRENTIPSNSNMVEYRKLSKQELQSDYVIQSTGKYEIGRFMNTNPTKVNVFPVLNRSIIAFSRHKGDKSVILIPDTEFIGSHGYESLKRIIDIRDIPWKDKISKVVWRGKEHGPGYQIYNLHHNHHHIHHHPNPHRHIYYDSNNSSTIPIYSQRRYFFNYFKNRSYVDVKIGPGGTTKKYLLQYKYQLDIDGEVNAWSGLWWKLYSNSVVFKVNSHFEQWYYQDLKPWIHYIPIFGNFSDFDEKYIWALSHDEECERIAQNSKSFIQNYTYEKSLLISL